LESQDIPELEVCAIEIEVERILAEEGVSVGFEEGNEVKLPYVCDPR
jgi:hypothetical protein